METSATTLKGPGRNGPAVREGPGSTIVGMSSPWTLAEPTAGEDRAPDPEDRAVATPRSSAPVPSASGGPAIDAIRVAAYSIPTDRPESDGTLEWRRTVLVVATVEAGGERGLGYTYASPAAALVASGTLGPAIQGIDAFDTARCWRTMVGAVRNSGRPGIAATAISALDVALWDLKARLLSAPLVDLLGRRARCDPGLRQRRLHELRRRRAREPARRLGRGRLRRWSR